jgi:hypothetical protein
VTTPSEHVVADPDPQRPGLLIEEDGRQGVGCAAEELGEIAQH